jgi:hypothetical protein
MFDKTQMKESPTKRRTRSTEDSLCMNGGVEMSAHDGINVRYRAFVKSALGRSGKLSIATPMHSTQLGIGRGQAGCPKPGKSGARRLVSTYRASHSFVAHIDSACTCSHEIVML